MTNDLNKRLSGIFHDMASMYNYLGNAEHFRASAYEKAARVIGSLPEEVSAYEKAHPLKDLPGIGEGIAEKIEEYISTGKMKKYEELKKSVPYELMEIAGIRGFGPASLKRIHEELNISGKKELINALQDGTIAGIKGFGEKKVDNMLRGLQLHKTIEERMLLWDASVAGKQIRDWLGNIPEVKQAELAGSLRRKKETIGDLDILVSCEKKYRKKIADLFSGAGFVKQVLAKGDTKISVLLKEDSRQVDLRMIKEDEWGSALQYFTGSKEHNIQLRLFAKDKGYRISEYGIFHTQDEKRIAAKTEEEFYQALGLQMIPPELREDRGEIELAKKNKLPALITQKEIKGDFHSHSIWSDGINTPEEIAKHIKKTFSYEYIVLTDHSKSARIAHGMDEKQILKQLKSIERLNRNLGGKFVKAGIEVDILVDGKLDISDEILSRLDWVIASIHSNFNKDNTERLISACENKNVCCIGHPTGRLIGSREPYKLDMELLIKSAKRTHTTLEINAQPRRMDLNDELALQAEKAGVSLAIGTDSHALGNFSYMELGVGIARRAWCTKNNILNTKSWKEIEAFRNKKRKP
jgi:DNA polymerase (family 10)